MATGPGSRAGVLCSELVTVPWSPAPADGHTEGGSRMFRAGLCRASDQQPSRSQMPIFTSLIQDVQPVHLARTSQRQGPAERQSQRANETGWAPTAADAVFAPAAPSEGGGARELRTCINTQVPHLGPCCCQLYSSRGHRVTGLCSGGFTPVVRELRIQRTSEGGS